MPARAGGEVAVGLSFIPQEHGGALSYGGIGRSASSAGSDAGAGSSLYNESRVFFLAEGLEDFTARVADLPLLANPGDRWNYSVSTDVLGRIVEIVSGQPLDVFVKTRVFDPLGMEDTDFWVPPEKRSRFTANYSLVDGVLEMADSPTDGEYTEAPAWLSGGGGLTSTATHPDRVDSQRIAQVVHLVDDALQVSNAVSGRVLEASWIDLIHDTGLPPFVLLAVGQENSLHHAPVRRPGYRGIAHPPALIVIREQPIRPRILVS